MFGVGLHFSVSDLWRVRGVAMRGAPIQIAIATLTGFALTRLWGWTPSAGVMFGLSISVASTVVLLRTLMDHSLLGTRDGKVAIGWLVVEDLATILILVLLPVLAGGEGGTDWGHLGITLVSVLVFVAVMLFAGARLIPLVLSAIARTRSRELFILAILVIALGIAIAAAELLGVSIALGAFVAGVVISESPVSHQVGADVLPFREAFAVLFFVSVGMLVDPIYLVNNVSSVLLVAGVILIAKPVWTFLISLVLSRSPRTALVTAGGLSQMGEFSFVMGQAGMSLGLLTHDQYSLILAGAIITITVNPLVFRLVDPVEAWLHAAPGIMGTHARGP